MTSEHPFTDVFYYLQGNLRYKLYYSKYWKWLIRKHIKEQIDYRIRIMNPVCYQQGSCIKCGCATTALQMCNKMCEGYCYPSMLNKYNWHRWKLGAAIKEGPGLWWLKVSNLHNTKDYKLNTTLKYILYKETPTGYTPISEINAY